jgi:hypothetical protein
LENSALDASAGDIFQRIEKNQQNVRSPTASNGITLFSMGQDESFRVGQVNKKILEYFLPS